jgi:apolipoprotein N-acyltransferase
LAQINWVSPATDDKLSVALIQANIPQEEKWLSEQLRPTLDLYRQMSEKAWSKDLIVWPETAIPRLYHRANAYLSYMDAEAKKQHSAIITGIPYKQPDTGSYHNSIIAIGEGSGIYHKQRLVPFGEYIPMEKWLRGLIEFFDLPMSNFSLAPDAQALLKVGKLQLAPFICYEIVYPDLVAATVPKADLLITISNDTWFGKSHGPLQHFQMAQMRALENGRYLIRGTNNGVSALINEKGQVINRADQFVRTTLYGEVQAMSGLTPFARGGTRPVVIFCFAVLALLLGLKHLRRQHQGQN